MTALLVFLAVGIVFLVCIATIKVRTQNALAADVVAYGLRFPAGLEAASVESFLVGVSGLLAPWWKRWIATPFVVLEVVGNEHGITHRLVVAARWAGVIEHQLQAALPGVRYETLENAAPVATQGVEYRLSTNRRPLRIDAVGTATKLLTSLQPLASDEVVTVQWVLSPAPPTGPVRVMASGERRAWWSSNTPVVENSEAASALRQKHAQPLLLAAPRIGVQAPSVSRARQLLRQAEVALHGTRSVGVHFRRRMLTKSFVASRAIRRTVPLVEWPVVANVVELAGLVGWPLGNAQFIGLASSGCRYLAPSAELPTTGTVLGDAHASGTTRSVAMDLEARFCHLMLLGPTGVGKSTLQLHLIVQDMLAGHAVIVVDPKSDLIADVLPRVPEHRRGDVVVLDPSDAERPVGFNPLRAAGVAPELAAEQFVNVLAQLFAANWGVRSSDIWRGVVQTLAVDPDATLADVGTLLVDACFRARLVSKVTDPMTLGFWAWFESLSPGEQHQATAPVLNKFRALLSRPGLRRTFAQPSPTFDLARAINGGGIVLVPLASGLLGADASNLFGAVVLNSVWNLVQGRAALAHSERRPLMVHLDEFARYAALPVPLDELLAQARGYRVGVSLAFQHLNQLTPDMRHTVIANPRTRIAWQLGNADAAVMARELGRGLTVDDLASLDAYQVAAQIFAGGRAQPTCTLATRPAPLLTSDGGVIRAESRARWGVDGAALDAALMARLGGESSPSATEREVPGRKRRGDQ